jgi:thiamine-phosphate pyrophosphorylase
MPTRQTLPTEWLLTDRRIGVALRAAIERVPRGGGVLLRHHEGDLALAERVARACATRGLMLAVAGDGTLARQLGAAMVHNPCGAAGGLLVSRSVHDAHEATAARGADLIFVSPIYGTASHRDAAPIGIEAGLTLAKLGGAPGIALGGMNPERGGEAIRAGFYGWGAIGAWLRDS